MSRARNAIRNLLDLAPSSAQILREDGQWENQDVRSVVAGALVRVRPGERFAFDGVVRQGHSSADESPITGESIPVEKSPGDQVFAGTINQYAELVFEVRAPASDTVLAQIIHAVEQAQGSRAPIQRFVDQFAAVYTPAVFVIALLVAFAGPLALGLTWLESIYKALVLLVIACPCALVISTPVTIVSGLTASARRGVLIKGGAFLEQAHRLKLVALDKTGTLTWGRPELVAEEVLTRDLSRDAVLQIAVSLARRSDHPVSLAIARGLQSSDLPVDAFIAEPGRGVEGVVAGHRYRLGNHRWMHAQGLCQPQIEQLLAAHEHRGHTLSLLADERAILAMFAVADTIRDSSIHAVRRLQAMNVRVVMLTGDNALTARSIAAQAGIDEVHADLLPEGKLDKIRELSGSIGPAAMVGDGINDSPALASADIGFAMGVAGTDIATEAADVVIMNDDLGRIPDTILLSRRVHGILWQNISLALGIKLVFLLLAVFDHATMWMAVFADMGASLLVVLNGLRLVAGQRQVSGKEPVQAPTSWQ